VWRVPLVALLFGATIWVVGRWAPSKRRPIKWVSFGSAVAVVGWLVASAGYGVWVTQISSVGSALGSVAAVFVFIVFTYVSCVVYLAGAVVDASVRARRPRAARREHLRGGVDSRPWGSPVAR
jgi:membrane protein